MLNTAKTNMNKIKISLVTLSILWIAFAFISNQDWKITKEYSVQFSNNDVVGVFKKMEGKVTFDESNLTTSKFELSIDLSSVNTGNQVQNGHIKNSDWLDIKKYQFATFVTTSISKNEQGFNANGTFDLHGTKKEIIVPFKFEKSKSKAKIIATFSFNRLDYGVGNEKDGVDTNMKIEVSLPIKKTK